jgi:surface antigen
VLGGLVGAQIGKQIDKQGRERAAAAEQKAMTTNQPVSWESADSHARGEVMPTHTYRNDQGQECRVFTHSIVVDSKPESATATACQQRDGGWKVVAP